MDILITLALLAVLYLVPELLRKRKPKEYQYPDIQEPQPRAEIPTILVEKTAVSEQRLEESPSVIHSESPALTVAPALQVSMEASPWSKKLNQAAIVNGIIFTEILQPPRAYRPFVQRRIYKAEMSEKS